MSYSNSKIYKITSPTAAGMVYYGSTKQKYLSSRLSQHISHYNSWTRNRSKYITSFELVKHGDATITLVRSVNVKNKDELKAIERIYIENNECVNKNIPGRTSKEYYEANYDKISSDNKQKYIDNRTTMLKYQNNYYKKNSAQINADMFTIDNKPYMCDCGMIFKRPIKAKHYATGGHQAFMASGHNEVLKLAHINKIPFIYFKCYCIKEICEIWQINEDEYNHIFEGLYY